MNKYLKYLFKTHKNLMIVVGIFGVVFTIPSIIQHFDKTVETELLTNLVVYGVFLSVILPIMLLNFVHSRSGNDSYFALPVSRKDMIVSILTFSYLVTVVPYLVLSILGFILIKTGFIVGTITLSSFLLIVFISLISFLSIIIFTSGTYLIANNIFDGIVITLAYYFLPIVIFAVIGSYEVNMTPGLNSSITAVKSFSLSIIYMAGRCLYFLFENGNVAGLDIFKFIICAVIYIVIGLISIKVNFINRKSERAGNISRSIFSYPFIISQYTVCLIFLISSYFKIMEKDELALLIILYAFVFVAYTIANFIYRRKVEFKITDSIVFILIVVVSIFISNLCWNSHCFGEGDNLTINSYPVVYRYSEFSDEKEISFEIVANNEDDYQEVTKILNKYRETAIDDYYANNGEITNATLTIEEGVKDNYSYSIEYCYGNYQKLSDKELEEIGQYTTIETFVYND